MRIIVLLCLFGLAITATGQAFDTDGDGVADWNATVLKDEDHDGSFDRASHPGTTGQPSDTLLFTKAWDSGTILNNQWDACCGYFDDDSLLDILGHHWNPNMLHVFESDGTGGYNHVWQQAESLPPGSYVSVTAGDPDDDGDIEILGGECSSLGKVVLFENIGNDTWGNPVVPARLRGERIRVVRVADTNGNGKNEIIIIAGNTDGGGVYIFEHTGPPGVHTYTQIYHYSTVSYLFQGGVGDVDNDGFPEVLIGCGGWHGFPMYIRRIAYDSVAQSYSHRMFQSTVIGLHLAPMAADVDDSPGNELVVGSSGDPNGQVHVFKYTDNDSFQPVWSSGMTTNGNAIAVQAASFEGFDTRLFFAAPFAGAVYGFVQDGSGFRTVGYVNPGTGSAIRSIDAAHDTRDQLVLAESAPANYVSVYRRDPSQGMSALPRVPQPQALTVHPNPCRGRVTVKASQAISRAEVYDCTGSRVAVLDVDETGTACWIPAPNTRNGIYLVRAITGAGTFQARVVTMK